MAEEWQGIRSAPSGSSNYVEGGVMGIQKEKLIAEIENFKTEILKIQVVKVWAESHSNSDPFKHVILEKEDCKVWWMEAQAHQLWETWLAAKAQAVPEGFVLVPQDMAKDTDRLNFLLGGDRYIRTVAQRDIQNEDYEKIGEHYLFTEVYWIDGWDYHENSSSQSERGAIDKAMIEVREPGQ
ncbi:hypothetical protein KXJ74_07090 [Acinetobacter johnsonii]|nr:hypothetical protein KXJ74_07090 [Acinetobacter johnsonii]